jgi:hypothetical protein
VSRPDRKAEPSRRRYSRSAHGCDRLDTIAGSVEIAGDARTGSTTRWRTQVTGCEVEYGDVAAGSAGRLLSEPLTAPMTVTETPVVRARVAASAPDAAVFAYLEAIDAEGPWHLLTDGQLRLRCRARGHRGERHRLIRPAIRGRSDRMVTPTGFEPVLPP